MKHLLTFIAIAATLAAGAAYLTDKDDSQQNETRQFYLKQKEENTRMLAGVQNDIDLVQKVIKDLRTQEDEECNSLRTLGIQERQKLKKEMTASKAEEEKERESLRASFNDLKFELNDEKREKQHALMQRRMNAFAQMAKKEEEMRSSIISHSLQIGENKKTLIRLEEAITYSADLSTTEKVKKKREQEAIRESLLNQNKSHTLAIQTEKEEFENFKIQTYDLIRQLDRAIHKNDREYLKKLDALALKKPKATYKQISLDITQSLQDENINILKIKDEYRKTRSQHEEDLKVLHEEKNKINANLSAAAAGLKEHPKELLDKKSLIQGTAAGLILIFAIFYFFTVRSTRNLYD